MNLKSPVWVWLCLCLFSSVMAFGQQEGQRRAPQAPPTETIAPDIPGVVAGGTKVQVIKSGFQGTEGPVALPDGTVIFSEPAASRITRIDENGNTSTFVENTNASNGLAFDLKGRLISTQITPGKGRVGVVYPKGSEEVLAADFEGKPLGRPNDLVVDKKGGVYFTDPEFKAPALTPAVFYIPPGGKAIKIAEDIVTPNGIQLSPDEKILYVNNTRGEYLLAFDVQPDGTVRNRRNFAKYEGVTKTAEELRSGADGLAIDSQGRTYVATPVGIQVFSTTGEHLGTIPLSVPPQNLAFSGPDKKTLYIVGRGAALKIQMLAQGFKGRAK